jgi:hypothetical protein
MSSLSRVRALRFVLPPREAGSMPALVDGDDGAAWVVKLRGAAQGARVLVAEVICGDLARARRRRSPTCSRAGCAARRPRPPAS